MWTSVIIAELITRNLLEFILNIRNSVHDKIQIIKMAKSAVYGKYINVESAITADN
jgi:hypothetical protein